jgi:hypothetical protein
MTDTTNLGKRREITYLEKREVTNVRQIMLTRNDVVSAKRADGLAAVITSLTHQQYFVNITN